MDQAKLNFLNVLYHYAVRTSDNCIRFDDLAELMGGLYTRNDCTKLKYCETIYKRCRREWKENLQIPVIKTYYSEEIIKEKYSCIIHIYWEPKTEHRRERIRLETCFKMAFPHDIGFARVFSFPCKLVLSWTF